MAAEEAAAEPAAAGISKKMIVLIAAAAILAGGIGVGVTVMLLGGGGDDAAVAEEETQEAEAPPPTDPIYITLEPEFVVNFKDRANRNRLLKTDLSLVAFDKSSEKAVKAHMPALRNGIVVLLARQVYEDVLPADGKQELRAAALTAIQNILAEREPEARIEDVYFASFVVQ